MANPQPSKIPTLSRQLISPSVTELVEVQGLHSLFACLRTINPSVVFFCHTFCIPRIIGTLLFLVPQKINKPIHTQGKKNVCTPTATTVLHLRQKKTTQSYYT